MSQGIIPVGDPYRKSALKEEDDLNQRLLTGYPLPKVCSGKDIPEFPKELICPKCSNSDLKMEFKSGSKGISESDWLKILIKYDTDINKALKNEFIGFPANTPQIIRAEIESRIDIDTIRITCKRCKFSSLHKCKDTNDNATNFR